MDTSIRSAGGCPCRLAPGQADPLPFYAPGGCGAPSFLETTAATPMETLLLYGSYAAVWAVMWLACGLLVVPVVSRMPPSSKAHENNSMYAGQKVAASLKAWAVGGIANLALYQYAAMPTGSLDVAFAGHPLMDFAGILFTGFEVADLALGLGYGFLDATHIVHHILHIAICALARATCGFGLLAATLMAQETSGLPLNYYLLMRHRAPDHWSTRAAQVAFAGAFFSWRLLVGTYGTYHFVYHARDHLPADIPPSQARLLGASLVAANVLQWYWGVTIGKMAARVLRGHAGRSKEKAA